MTPFATASPVLGLLGRAALLTMRVEFLLRIADFKFAPQASFPVSLPSRRRRIMPRDTTRSDP
jgi:hypothetical protein